LPTTLPTIRDDQQPGEHLALRAMPSCVWFRLGATD
jgi:hypothetical protein